MQPMYILDDFGYIDLESRRRVQMAAVHWQEATQSSLRAARRAHITFICKVYLVAIGLVAGGVLQWLVITSDKHAAKLVKRYNFVILGPIFLNFIMMVLMQNVLRSERPKTKLTTVLYIFLTVEIGSVTLARPIAQSMALHLACATALTLGIVALSLCIALAYHLEMEQDPQYLTMWAMRYFLATATCLLMTLTFDNLHVQISITLLLTFFVSIFIIIWGRSLGSFTFYREESSYLSFYITLAYLIFLSLFANSLVFFQKV